MTSIHCGNGNKVGGNGDLPLPASIARYCTYIGAGGVCRGEGGMVW